jgi:hypothetical protein
MYEVFPVLHPNLISVAGEWAGFDKEWLFESIRAVIENKSIMKKWRTEVAYYFFKHLYKDYWKRLESVCNEL